MGDRTGFAWKDAAASTTGSTSWSTRSCKQVKVLPSDLCTDAEFVRRVYLDLTGLPPTAGGGPGVPRRHAADRRSSATSWSTSSSAARTFVEHWTNKWADLLQVNRKFLGDAGRRRRCANWIRKAVADEHALRPVRLRAS